MTLPIEPISGTVYPTISGKPGITTFQNPPFHPNILNIGGANKTINPPFTDSRQGPTSSTSGFQRGLFTAGAGAVPGITGNVQYQINFLYNPATIYESRTLDINNQALPQYARNPDDPGSYATGLNSTVSFSLLFDRTFELWDSNYVDTLPGVYGVRVDVEAFYNLLGINYLQPQTSTFVGPVAPPETNTGRATNVVQNTMMLVPCNLYFGSNSRGALSYFGFISEVDITYSHFAADMTPSRCEVDVTFTCMPKLTSSTTG